MIYCIYHIPGKKIGVTNNPRERIEKIQGYSNDEYEILAMSEDIGYISDLEIELQKKYGYLVERQSYKNLITIKKEDNTMNINITENTTTFPCSKDNLKELLEKEMGMSWETSYGDCHIDNESIQWIMSHVRTSMYNDERCYVYNKALTSYINCCGDCEPADEKQTTKSCDSSSSYGDFDKIRDWAKERGIYKKGDPKTQYLKLMEEAGELGRAILKDDQLEVVDAIGDMVVVLTNLAELRNVSIEACIRDAYSVISKRTGKMQNGTFVKDTL